MLEEQLGQSHQRGPQLKHCRVVGGVSRMPNVQNYLDCFGSMVVSWLEHSKTIDVGSKPWKTQYSSAAAPAIEAPSR